MVGEGSLAALGGLDPARVRANLVVEGGRAFAEDDWVGRDVAVGSAVLRFTTRTPRCAVLDLDPLTGARGSGVLTALTTLRGTPTLGVDGHVLRPGTVRPGDEVTVVG
nr:MOSC domain-containing protein [Nocardioides marinisabuli]